MYQEALEEGKVEGKLETVPFLLTLGASVEQIAEALSLEIEQVRHKAVSHMLASEMSVEQVAEALGLDVELVRQAASDNPLSEETAEESDTTN